MAHFIPEYDIKKVFSAESLNRMSAIYDKEIARITENKKQLIQLANDRIRQINTWEASGNYKILGSTYKNGKQKCIILIIRYPDETQRDLRFHFNKIADMRTMLNGLREKYSSGDWTSFSEDI